MDIASKGSFSRMKVKFKRILIVEGSQQPPTFVGNLINGLLEYGNNVCLLGKFNSKKFSPIDHKTRFSRIITQRHQFNKMISLYKLVFFLLFFPRLSLSARMFLPKGNWKEKALWWIILIDVMRFSPDVIHFQWATHTKPFQKLILSDRYKVVVSLRGRQINVSPFTDPGTAELYRKIFPRVNSFHAVSKAIGEVAQQFDASPDRITVIKSPVPKDFLAAFSPIDFHFQPEFKILSIGRFNWMKGYDFALDALRLMLDRKMLVKYTIVSPGDIPEELLYQIDELGLQSFVEIIPGVAHKEIISLMKNHSVLLLPSVIEGIANVVLEAMAVGLPVISTNCGGMSEVIDGKNGILVKSRDPEAISNGVRYFLSLSSSEIDEMCLNALRTIEGDFYFDNQISKFISIYNTI